MHVTIYYKISGRTSEDNAKTTTDLIYVRV